MQAAMSIHALLSEVTRQTHTKVDKITSTKDNIRLVPTLPHETGKMKLVLLRDGAMELERYGISEHAHGQIASRLEIPHKYYNRLLDDHPDMVIDQVNKLFEREPSSRLIRILDGQVRAFLSDRYLRLDNYEVLENALPLIVKGDHPTELLASHVDSDRMNIKCLFVGDELSHQITTARGQDRIIRPGFRLTNSEVGGGSFKIQAFFYDGYCKNGCVWGLKEAFSFERTHLGGKLIEGIEHTVISSRTVEAVNELVKSQTIDALKALCSKEVVGKMVDNLRAAASTTPAISPVGAVDLAIKTLPLRESEREGILETFMRDGDYTKWGLASAVTELANKDSVPYKRVNELEDIGAQILSLDLRKWDQFAHAEALAA